MRRQYNKLHIERLEDRYAPSGGGQIARGVGEIALGGAGTAAAIAVSRTPTTGILSRLLMGTEVAALGYASKELFTKGVTDVAAGLKELQASQQAAAAAHQAGTWRAVARVFDKLAEPIQDRIMFLVKPSFAEKYGIPILMDSPTDAGYRIAFTFNLGPTPSQASPVHNGPGGLHNAGS